MKRLHPKHVELTRSLSCMWICAQTLSGYEILRDPTLNCGMAFDQAARKAFKLRVSAARSLAQHLGPLSRACFAVGESLFMFLVRIHQFAKAIKEQRKYACAIPYSPVRMCRRIHKHTLQCRACCRHAHALWQTKSAEFCSSSQTFRTPSTNTSASWRCRYASPHACSVCVM
jgi:hypothetical protein